MNNIKKFENFVNEEITDTYLRDKLAKAKEGGRQISSGYEEELHKKRNILDTANNRREDEKQRVEQEKKWREFQDNAEEIQTMLTGKMFNVDGLPFKVSQVRASIGPTLEMHFRPIETNKIEKIVISFYKKSDDMKAFIYSSNDTGKAFPMPRMSELFGTLTQVFKKYFPESKFADRKMYSALENVSTEGDDKVNELFGARRDMKTRKNLANIKEISDKQKENTPEGKLAKYKKMQDDLVKELEDYLEDEETNEELKPETYISAADKLKEKGHTKRADRLRNYVKELGKNIDPITVELYGKTYTMGADNLELDGRDDYRYVAIWYDLSTKLTDDQEEPDDYDGPMLTCINFYKDRTERVRVGDTSPNVKHSDRKYTEKRFPGWTFEVDGVAIPNRKVATKVMKLVKDWAKTIEDREIAKEIEKLSANDLYFE